MSTEPTVSAVIPTRNRKESLFRLLRCLDSQEYPLLEIIIVDSSDEKIELEVLNNQFKRLKIKLLNSEASVCIQRNIGVKEAKGEVIFLCDDDIEVENDYVKKLAAQFTNSNVEAVTGMVVQKEGDQWVSQYPPNSFKGLLYSFVFQQSIWGELDGIKTYWFTKPIYNFISWFYKKRGNGISLAGWPVITNFSKPSFKTRYYGLGASLIAREFLINNPFDEVFDPHGIGDNYGIAMHLKYPIVVVADAVAYHHQSNDNRLDSTVIYYRRILALHYLLKRNQVELITRLWFLWSLVGNLIFNRRKSYRKATWVTIRKVISGNNPYWIAFKNNQKCILPYFSR